MGNQVLSVTSWWFVPGLQGVAIAVWVWLQCMVGVAAVNCGCGFSV